MEGKNDKKNGKFCREKSHFAIQVEINNNNMQW